jgi:arylsulfatase A-like enzyme
MVNKFMLWEESTRVPLLMAGPGIPQGQTDAPVGLIDLYPTFADLCGLDAPDHLEGASLRPLLRNPQARWDHMAITSWSDKTHSARSERWRYTRYSDGSEELYDHQKDPYEWTNLAGRAEHAEVIARHRQHVPTE